MINFCPSRSRISKELDQCASLSDLERLLRICRSCIYRIFEMAGGIHPLPATHRLPGADARWGDRIERTVDHE